MAGGGAPCAGGEASLPLVKDLLATSNSSPGGALLPPGTPVGVLRHHLRLFHRGGGRTVSRRAAPARTTGVQAVGLWGWSRTATAFARCARRLASNTNDRRTLARVARGSPGALRLRVNVAPWRDSGERSAAGASEAPSMPGNTSWAPGCGGPRKSRTGFWPTRSRSGWSRGTPARKRGGEGARAEARSELFPPTSRRMQRRAMWSAASRIQAPPGGRQSRAALQPPGSPERCRRDQGVSRTLPSRSVARLLKARREVGGPEIRRDLGGANTELDPKDVALRYKQLWIERTFRTAQHLVASAVPPRYPRRSSIQSDGRSWPHAARGASGGARAGRAFRKAGTLRDLRGHRNPNRTGPQTPRRCAAAFCTERAAIPPKSPPTPPPHPTSRHPRLRKRRNPELHRNAVPRTLGTNRKSPETVKDESEDRRSYWGDDGLGLKRGCCPRGGSGRWGWVAMGVSRPVAAMPV